VFNRHLAGGWCGWLIVQRGAAEREQIGLRSEWQFGSLALDQGLPLVKTQAGSFFFSQLTCVVRRPISP
jgi:hypothetical protein